MQDVFIWYDIRMNIIAILFMFISPLTALSMDNSSLYSDYLISLEAIEQKIGAMPISLGDLNSLQKYATYYAAASQNSNIDAIKKGDIDINSQDVVRLTYHSNHNISAIARLNEVFKIAKHDYKFITANEFKTKDNSISHYYWYLHPSQPAEIKEYITGDIFDPYKLKNNAHVWPNAKDVVKKLANLATKYVQ